MQKNCLKCNKIFHKKINYSKNYWSTAKFCSPRCGSLDKHNKLGKTGYKHTIEAKRKIGIASMGSKNTFWKGGTSSLKRQIINLFEYRQWRSDVYTRDNYICQNCGVRGGKLECHHIKGFSKILKEYKIDSTTSALECLELWNINNGQTLCIECHKLTDNYGGKANNRSDIGI